jgi:hypothetical protein
MTTPNADSIHAVAAPERHVGVRQGQTEPQASACTRSSPSSLQRGIVSLGTSTGIGAPPRRPTSGPSVDERPYDRSYTPGHRYRRVVDTVRVHSRRWLLGTHQGGIAVTHLQDYLDEFTFRFNRRASRARGLLFFRLLEQAATTDLVRYRDLVVTPGAGNRNAHPPGPKRIAPDTLALPPLDRPWRNATR